MNLTQHRTLAGVHFLLSGFAKTSHHGRKIFDGSFSKYKLGAIGQTRISFFLSFNSCFCSFHAISLPRIFKEISARYCRGVLCAFMSSAYYPSENLFSYPSSVRNYHPCNRCIRTLCADRLYDPEAGWSIRFSLGFYHPIPCSDK